MSSPPPVPPKDSVRDTSRIPAPQLLAERAIYTAPRVEPICPTTAKSSSTVAPTSGTKSRRPTPTITETRATATPQVKLKKSLRKLFHREDKGTSKPAARAPAVESQRPSQITSSCPRVPSSATVSKAEVPDKTETEPTRCKSEKHISRVQQLREHDTEHKRAVETVDSMVACIEHSKEARTAAAQAEMFAKKAEAHAAASQASLQKFLELAGSGPDPEVIGSFMGLFRNAGLTPPSIE